MVITLDSHASVRGSNPDAIKSFFFLLLLLFSIHVRDIFYPFVTTLKLHISYKISLVSPYCYFFFISFFIFSPTVSKRIFINEMMLLCYLSTLVILNLLNRCATLRM